MLSLLLSKPVLIGLHLGAGILAIDAALWLLGELVARAGSIVRRKIAAALTLVGFLGSWIIGGYYYVTVYGPLVKPVIKKGAAPWAHAVAMEAKEHVFLFLIPIALTVLIAASLRPQSVDRSAYRTPLLWIVGSMAGLGLYIGALGFIISAAARWG